MKATMATQIIEAIQVIADRQVTYVTKIMKATPVIEATQPLWLSSSQRSRPCRLFRAQKMWPQLSKAIETTHNKEAKQAQRYTYPRHCTGHNVYAGHLRHIVYRCYPDQKGYFVHCGFGGLGEYVGNKDFAELVPQKCQEAQMPGQSQRLFHPKVIWVMIAAQSIKAVWVMEEIQVLDVILVIDATHSIQVLET